MTEILAAISNALASIQKKNGGWAVMFIILAGWVFYDSYVDNESRKVLVSRMQRTIDSLKNELITAKIEAAQYIRKKE